MAFSKHAFLISRRSEMGIFDLSHPPRCSGPSEYDPVCEVCGGAVDNNACICPECPVCGEIGDPASYEEHGLIKAQAQIAQRAAVKKPRRLSENRSRSEGKPF